MIIYILTYTRLTFYKNIFIKIYVIIITTYPVSHTISMLICLIRNLHLKMLIFLQYRRITVHHAVSIFRCVYQLYILSINLSHNNVYAAPTTFTPILSKTAYLSPNNSAAIESAPNVLNTVCHE